MEHPGVGLVGAADVVLGQQAGQPGGQGAALHPALAGPALLQGGHEHKVPRDQLQLVLVLGHVGVHDLEALQGRDATEN